MASPAVMIDVDGPHGPRQVRLSSPDRVLWPQVGVTKHDLARYVVAVGAGLLRALGDRPVTLQRFPDGVEGEAFYSKNPPRGVPEWVRTVDVTYPSGRRHAQLVVDEVATAVWAVQMNTITWHPWPVRTGDQPAGRAADRPGPPARAGFHRLRRGRAAAARAAGRARADRLGQDVRQPRCARVRPDPARA